MTLPQRLLALITEVDVRPGQTPQQLAEKFGCNKRTIQRDVSKLAELGLVMVNEQGYRFLTKPFLPPMALSRQEVSAIILAHQLVESQLDRELREAFQSAVDKMRRGLNSSDRRTAEKLQSRTAALPEADTQSDTSAPLFIRLTEAIERQQRIKFLYQGRGDTEPETREVDPLGLFFQDGRWYLHTYDQNRKGVRTFRLARMSDLRLTPTRFEPEQQFNPERAAFHQWDIAGEKPVELTLRVSEDLGRWFEENKPHPSVKRDGDRVTLKIKDPESFLRWFASLDEAELIAPKLYRAVLRDRIEKLRQLYS